MCIRDRSVLLVFFLNGFDLGRDALHLEHRLHLGEAQREQGQVDDQGLQEDGPTPVRDDVAIHPFQPEEERAGDDAEPAEINDGAEIGLSAGDAGDGDGFEIGESLGTDIETSVGCAFQAADGLSLIHIFPIEAGLGWMQGREGCLRTRSGVLNGTRQAAVVANGRIRRIVVGGHELDVFVTEAEIVERLLNEVGVLVANVAELGGGNADEQNFIAGVAVASGFEPGVVGMAVDLFFESVEDARPRIRDDGGTGKRHCLPE